MSDYIKREDVLSEFAYDDLDEYCTPQIAAIVKDIPSADVEPVRHGRWEAVNTDVQAWTIQCSACKMIGFTGKMPYCPNCGARMDAKK